MSADDYGFHAGYEDEGAARRQALDSLTRRLADQMQYDADGLFFWYDAAELQPTPRALSLAAAAAVAVLLAHDRGQMVGAEAEPAGKG